jgi:hypothetical protein
MSNFLNKIPVSPITSFGNPSVPNGSTIGTNFSILQTGGYMEVYTLSGLTYTIPPATTGIIEFSGNSIPIQFTKGSGSAFSPDVLTLNSDNISSGRRKLGMLVYVYETNKIYQFRIDNYDTLWNNATGATGPGGSTVVISNFGTTVKNNSAAGIALINAWTASTISGVGGYNDTNASWRVLSTGGNNGSTFTGGTVSGATNFTGGLTANTISATTYQNLPVSGVTGGTGISASTSDGLVTIVNTSPDQTVTISGGTGIQTGGTYPNFVITNTEPDQTVTITGGTNIEIDGTYPNFGVSITGVTELFNNYLPLSGGTVTGETIFTSGLTANTFSAGTYYNLPKLQNVITVAKSGGDFTSIKSAVDSITDSSSDNRYVISVAPGKYVEDSIIIQGKEFISIVGYDILEVVVVANNPSQTIFRLGNNNQLSFMTISGATNGIGILCEDFDGGFALVHKVSLYDCDTGIYVHSILSDTSFFGEYVDLNGDYTYGTFTLSENGYKAYTNMESYYSFPTGPNTTIGNLVQGSGSTLNVFVADGVSNGVTGSTNYLMFDYASLNTTTTTVSGWDYGVRNTITGGPCRFDIDSISVVGSMTYDISVEHPNTFGTFNGSASHVKTNTVSEDVYWAFLDIEDGEFDITRKISITFQDGSHTDTSTLIFEGGTMGLMNGGTISLYSGLTVNVASGFGYLEKIGSEEIHRRIDWGNSQITLSANTENYLYFTENSILSASSALPNNTNNIVLGRVVTDSSTVRFIDLSPYNAKHTSNLLSDFNRNALGPVYASGSIVTQNVTPFHLNISQGNYYFSENNFLPTGGTDVNFVQYYRNGSGGWVTSATTEVVMGYDDNSGTISPLTLSAFTKHTLYILGEGVLESYFLVLGQNQYPTLIQTENADLPTPPTFFNDAVTPIASIYIQQGTTGITEVEDIRPVIGFKAGGVNASSLHANLLGLSADDHTQYLLVNGNRQMSGNLGLGGNTIYSAGTINGVTIQSHASRHKNGGDDEVATATPTPSEIPKADAFGKLDGWISDASSTVKGLTRLSVDPSGATTPIAVGVNDPRFQKSITGVTNTSNTLSFSNVTGETTNFTGLTLGSISATTYLNLPSGGAGSVSTSGSTLYSTSPATNSFSTTQSTFLGLQAGQGATGATRSIFIGALAGKDATNAAQSKFLGGNAGNQATNASNSNFIGNGAGNQAINANNSNFLGQQTGYQATGANNSNFLGSFVGNQAIGASYSTLIGYNVGTAGLSSNSIGFNNIIIGTNITLSAGTTNSINLGGVLFGTGTYDITGGTPTFSAQTNGRIGIGVVTPQEKLHVSGNTRVDGGLTANTISATTYLNLPSSGGSFTGGTVSGPTTFTNGLTANTISATTYRNLPLGSIATSGTTLYSTSPITGNFNTTSSIFLGQGAGSEATDAQYSNFLGQGAGSGATDAEYSNFFGRDAGLNASGASSSNFFGRAAGFEATNAVGSNFFGRISGYQATRANYSNFIGYAAGTDATDAQYSNFIGYNTGTNATNARGSTFMGFWAGVSATNAEYSNMFGDYAGYLARNANNSNFFGEYAGNEATHASGSTFIGYSVGLKMTGASYSTLIGYNVGSSLSTANSIGSNNIIIGTNITLSAGTTNSLNIGNVLYGINTYSTRTGNPSVTPQSTGRIGIGVVTPQEKLHVSGNTRVDGGLTATTISATTISATTYRNLPVSGVTSGTGISANTTNGLVTIVNTLPDQTVTISGGTNIKIDGTYPNFGINFTGSTGASGDYLPLSGGTVSGATIFTSGLTINSNFNYSNGTEQPGFVLITDVFGNASWGPVSGSSSGNYLSLSGGTVSGPTNFTGGLTANTITPTTIIYNDLDYLLLSSFRSTYNY